MSEDNNDAGGSGVPGGARDGRGMGVLTSSEFSLEASIGGVRGLIEALAPGVVFVVVFVVTRELVPTLIASLAVALIAVVARLVQRTPLTQALSGTFGVAIGVFWAWRTGDAKDFFALGLWTNGAYLALCLVSILVRWPVVGLIVEMLRGATGGMSPAGDEGEQTGAADDSGAPDTADVSDALASDADVSDAPASDAPHSIGTILTAWRKDPHLCRRYAAATWLWVGLFGVRLLVQLPLYLDGGGGAVGWLGTARLVMGVPLWALTLWLTWILVRQPGPAHAGAGVPDQPHPHLDR